jgi:hypothetical protein
MSSLASAVLSTKTQQLQCHTLWSMGDGVNIAAKWMPT